MYVYIRGIQKPYIKLDLKTRKYSQATPFCIDVNDALNRASLTTLVTY